MHENRGCPEVKLGVMQGRLLPKYLGRYQAHPLGYWQDELPIAAELGLECIEFIFDFNDYESNPLWSVDGRNEIIKVSSETDIKVHSVCADFFMECPLHSKIEESRFFAKETLIQLLQNCNDLEISDIVIPCVDQSSLASSQCMDLFKTQMLDVIPTAEKLGVNLSLETDLAPNSFKNLLDDLNSISVTVNYDTGNSAALGYGFRDELEAYGDKITDLHIKDRLYNSGPIPLGEGDVDFEAFFIEFEKNDFKGPVIMQAYRDDEGLSVFKQQMIFLTNLLRDLNWRS
jgi:L-ribulose-5-phosphate 3-epimerase